MQPVSGNYTSTVNRGQSSERYQKRELKTAPGYDDDGVCFRFSLTSYFTHGCSWSRWQYLCLWTFSFPYALFLFAFCLMNRPTYRRIIRNRSTEQFSGLPYIYALLNCLLCAWYGTPLVSSNNILVMTVNSIGAVFQLVYISLFIVYAERAIKMRMLGLLVSVVFSFGVIIVLSLTLFSSSVRRMFVGFLSCGSLISMFASPLFIINLVIRSKSVEYMPFYLSLSTFLMSISFCLYGILNADPFVYVPNGIGVLLGLTQLVVYSHYKNRPSIQDHTEPFITSYS